MANITSQIKRNRQNEKRRLRNKASRSELKTRARRALKAAEAGDAEAAATALREAQQHFDKAATQGIIHKNTAARRKARLSEQVRGLLG
jgi:small subunit ribosomal protein S20